jgi:GTPase SAR1 family protein
MHAAMELNEGLGRLEEIIGELPADSAHWNEAQNRFQFIDRLLTECLGWQKPDIAVEHPDGAGGRSDYHLGRQPIKAVLEAKREAVAFDSPPKGPANTLRKMAPILAASKDFKDAVTQVITYCAMQGVPIAIVCNGPQLAIFQAMVPGQSPLSGECYFFDGFRSYLEQFPLLWKLLSPEGVTENYAQRALAARRNPRLPPKASVSIAEPLKYRYRNDFQEELRRLSSFLLEEIEDNPELRGDFYRECYIPIEANNRHLLLSKNIIAARYRRVADNGVNPSALDKATSVDGGNVCFADSVVATASGSRPIVVVGDVGVGKTSFFENLFESLSGTEKANTYFLNLNLGSEATLSNDIKSYVLTHVPAQLKHKYGIDIDSADFANTVYYRELSDFDSSVKGRLKGIDPAAYERAKIDFLTGRIEQRDRHLQAALGHLAHGRKKQIILVLDNADQRDFEVQQQTFLIAQEFAATRNMLVFVSLRPSTFYLSKTTGSLAAYQNKILTISPPPADEVVQRRILFALRVAQGQVAPAALPDIRLQLGNVVSFLKATARSIKANDAIKQFLSNISGGNTRSIVELISGFFGSPNVDSRKIVDLEERTSSYRIPLHEFTKHALLGEYAYFNAQSSHLACNVFDVSSADPREHFLACLVVAFLSSNIGTMDNDGFVNGHVVVAEMASQGFVEEQVNKVLQRLARKRLVETPHAHYREIPVPDEDTAAQFHYRATSVGIYHIRYWAGTFAFLDAVATDTPIFEEETRAGVSKIAASFELGDRFTRTSLFRTYLESQWHVANFAANYFDFAELLRSQDQTFQAVGSVIARPQVSRR